MKKILFSVMAAMVSVASMAALSDYDGVYTTSSANIYVPAGSSTPGVYSMAITLQATGTNQVKLSIPDFKYGTGDDALNIGDIVVTLAATEKADGLTLENINAEGETGPNTETAGVAISTKIIITSATVVKDAPNILLLDLKVNGTIIATGAAMNDVARVEVTDASYSSTAVKEASKLSVYPTVATSVVNVPENGEFVIYSVGNGAAVKSGVVNNGTVSVADLIKGNYILSVNGKNARIIKK